MSFYNGASCRGCSCSAYLYADFCSQRAGDSPDFGITCYSVKHCSPPPPDWLNRELNSLHLGRRAKGGTSVPGQKERVAGGTQMKKEVAE